MRIRSEAERSTRVARIAGGLATIGLTLDVIIDSVDIGGPPSVTYLVALASLGVLWIWTLLQTRPTLRFGTTMFLAMTVATIAALTAHAERLAASPIEWVPYRAHHLAVLTVALLAPPRAWVGASAILGIVGVAVFQYALFPAEIRADLPYDEPTSMLFFGGFALVLLFYRLRADANERAITRALAEAELYQDFARTMLAVRDLSNSPMQTLTNIIEILRRQKTPDLQPTVACLEHAVERLTQLEEVTRPYERHLRWRAGDESWNPQEVLRDAVPPG